MIDFLNDIIHITRLHNENGYPQFDYKIEKIVTDTKFTRMDISRFVGGKTYVPTKGDKIFFVSGCDVPRFKVKQLCQKYEVALVKFIEKANAKFIGPNVVKSLFTDSCTYKVDKQYLLNYLYKVLGTEDVRYVPFLNELKNSPLDYVYANNGKVLHNLVNKAYFQLKFNIDTNWYNCNFVNNISYTALESISAYNQLVDIMKGEYYFNQDDILKIINTGAVMDEELREKTKRLFQSTDRSNHQVAMEAMANCDYEESAVSLLLLMKEFGQKMYDSGTRNHVNFKSLLTFFNVKNLCNVNFDAIIDCLRFQELLTVENLKILMPDVKNEMAKNANMNNFVVTEVALDPAIMVEIAQTENESLEVVREEEEQINPNFGGDPVFESTPEVTIE